MSALARDTWDMREDGAVQAGAAEEPLIGCVVAVTADRRRDDLSALLRRVGARVVEAPTLRLVPLDDDAALRQATKSCLVEPPDYVVATTGVGWRAWMAAADGWGYGGELLATLGDAIAVARGPKAAEALHASGLRERYAPASGSAIELLDWLRAQDLRGKRVAVQQHGIADPEFSAGLRAAGADVMPIPVYRWGPPSDAAAVRRLVEAVARREVHAVAFSSAPGATAFLDAAAEFGILEQVVSAFRTGVMAACIGPVCARPLESLDVAAVWPERGRLGNLVRTITDELPKRIRQRLPAGDREIVLQGHAVLIDDQAILLPPLPAAVLQELARKPGWVLSRAELLRRVWGGARRDEHAVEATVARLRAALGPNADLIRTVTKRGYRLAVDV